MTSGAGAPHPITPAGALDFPSPGLAETDYDGRFACVLGRGNMVATQFHPGATECVPK